MPMLSLSVQILLRGELCLIGDSLCIVLETYRAKHCIMLVCLLTAELYLSLANVPY